MSIPFSGLGSTGNQPQVTPEQLEKTASTAVARMAMGIARDFLEVKTTLEVNESLRKYQTNASRPTLPPLVIMREGIAYQPTSDDFWQPAYQELKNLFPAQFQRFFEAAMQIPIDQRNPNITLLDGALQTTARFLSALRQASGPIPPESLAATRALENIAAPYVALNALALNCQVLINEGQNYLGLVGANDPNHDRIAYFLNDLTTISSDLDKAAHLLTNSETEADGRKLLALLHKEITHLSERFDRTSGNANFHLFGNLLHGMLLTTAALTLTKPGEAPLLIGLTNATYGLAKSESDLGLFGAALFAYNADMTNRLEHLFLDKATPGQIALFQQLSSIGLMATIMAGTLTYDNTKVSATLSQDSPEATSEKNLAYELNLVLLTKSDMLSTAVQWIGDESGVESIKKQNFAALLILELLLALTLPALKGNDLASTTPILNALSDDFKTSLTTGSEAVREQSSIPELSAHFLVWMQQALIAFEKGDEMLKHKVVENGIKLTAASEEQFIDDTQALKEDAHILANAVTTSSSDDPTTGFNLAA